MLPALHDLQSFLLLSPAERLELARSTVALLGVGWRAVEGVQAGAVVRHDASGVDFALIPGGKFRMGLSDADIAQVAGQVAWDADWEYSLRIDGEAALYCVDVELSPFLLQLHLDDAAWMTRGEALDTALAAGYRLPTEAELEWVIRNGGREALHLGARPDGTPGGFSFQPSVFGLGELMGAHWAADDWFPSHEGAAPDGTSRQHGDPVGVCRITFPLDAFCCSEDITSLFAALRYPGSEAMPAARRFARTIPGT